jgi:glucokinase
MDVVLGVDLGGTNTAWGLVDRSGACPRSGSIVTTAFAGPAALVDAVAEATVAAAAAGTPHGGLEVRAVGIGAPNGNYHRGTVEDPPNLPWPGITPLAELFAARLALPAALTNDANAAAIGEGLFGAARGLSDFLVVTLGTGLGSGFVAGGTLLYGHDGFAGELGHTIIETDGRLCGCGRRGCLEQYASATGLVATARELLQTSAQASRLRNVPLEAITAKAVGIAATEGDPLACAAFEVTARVLGLALANAVAITSPQAVILFGGIAQAGEVLLAPLRKHFAASLHSIWRGKVELRVSTLHDRNAGVLGAAALAWAELDRGAKAAS